MPLADLYDITGFLVGQGIDAPACVADKNVGKTIVVRRDIRCTPVTHHHGAIGKPCNKRQTRTVPVLHVHGRDRKLQLLFGMSGRIAPQHVDQVRQRLQVLTADLALHRTHLVRYVLLLFELVQQQCRQDPRTACQAGIEHLFDLVMGGAIDQQQDDDPHREDRKDQHRQQTAADRGVRFHSRGIM